MPPEPPDDDPPLELPPVPPVEPPEPPPLELPPVPPALDPPLALPPEAEPPVELPPVPPVPPAAEPPPVPPDAEPALPAVPPAAELPAMPPEAEPPLPAAADPPVLEPADPPIELPPVELPLVPPEPPAPAATPPVPPLSTGGPGLLSSPHATSDRAELKLTARPRILVRDALLICERSIAQILPCTTRARTNVAILPENEPAGIGGLCNSCGAEQIFSSAAQTHRRGVGVGLCASFQHWLPDFCLAKDAHKLAVDVFVFDLESEDV